MLSQCSVNCTYAEGSVASPGGGPDWQRPSPLGHPAEPFVYIPLSTVNALLSAFSALFFLVRDKAVHPVPRRLVVTMSVFEILFHLSVIAAYANQVAQPRGARQLGSPPQLLALQTLLRFSLTMRNWTMGLISWSRLEAVCRPVSSRSSGRTLFKPAYIVAMETVAAVAGLALSVLMVTAQDARLSQAYWTQAELHAIEVVFYTYQGIIPILSILLATVITVAVLRKAGHLRRRLCTQQLQQMHRMQQQHRTGLGLETASADYENSVETERQELRRRQQRRHKSQRQAKRERRSIQLIVAMSLTCLVLESPTDVCGFIKNKAPLTELIVNTLVELDSLCNFFIYTCTTGILRQFCASGRGGREAANPDIIVADSATVGAAAGCERAPTTGGAGSTTFQRSPQDISSGSAGAAVGSIV